MGIKWINVCVYWNSLVNAFCTQNNFINDGIFHRVRYHHKIMFEPTTQESPKEHMFMRFRNISHFIMEKRLKTVVDFYAFALQCRSHRKHISSSLRNFTRKLIILKMMMCAEMLFMFKISLFQASFIYIKFTYKPITKQLMTIANYIMHRAHTTRLCNGKIAAISMLVIWKVRGN